MSDSAEVLKQIIADKEREIAVLRTALSNLYLARRKTCTHPNKQHTLAEKWCPDCDWHKDRSF